MDRLTDCSETLAYSSSIHSWSRVLDISTDFDKETVLLCFLQLLFLRNSWQFYSVRHIEEIIPWHFYPVRHICWIIWWRFNPARHSETGRVLVYRCLHRWLSGNDFVFLSSVDKMQHKIHPRPIFKELASQDTGMRQQLDKPLNKHTYRVECLWTFIALFAVNMAI